MEGLTECNSYKSRKLLDPRNKIEGAKDCPPCRDKSSKKERLFRDQTPSTLTRKRCIVIHDLHNRCSLGVRERSTFQLISEH